MTVKTSGHLFMKEARKNFLRQRPPAPEPMDVDNPERTGYMKTELISLSEVHPSRLQDMMPMSPDDYKALAQYVSPRDIDAVMSAEFENQN